MNRAATVAASLVLVACLAFGGWWFLIRDTSVPGEGACDAPDPEALVADVVRELPHDPEAFTQGLLVDGGELWESTGLRGQSDLRRVDADTGEVMLEAPLADDLFGEGLASGADGEMVQLTWTSGEALRWDRSGPTETGSFSYDGEGWGLTTLDDGDLVMSDGSDVLTVRSPQDFSVGSVLTVQRSDGDVGRLNELDWDGERLWANRYQTDEILRIDIDCGVVDAVVDASALTARAEEMIAAAGLDRETSESDVLNGIAWLGAGQPERYYVTGKRWPVMFEVEMVAAR